ncbi:MAG: transcriptional regulator [Rhodospirillaceae bacterium]|jgi:LysR family glycine cleavage system transcriptional activator|uniref:transcriptional regulator GcvA n=1 Tax=unclassified Hwanghaeella TaxID=2605944 RepID=UPI000C3AF4BD|nr:transcriptional regulator [Rhodospirillales bacterium]MAX48301.1 transcriptional regulator [Rhodospirillaceae bacterium]|tara:strand:- start:614 stop:1531 length:918 start_codon:yes stop_codon:yes gene_type:complete
MSDILPPIASLRGFEAAARHLNFSRAAAELFVTPAAISQQIRGLEDYYGTPLFIRTTRSLTLTSAGAAILPSVREGFAAFREVHRRLMAERESGLLTVSVYPTMAEKWLIPRLERFVKAHPDIDLRFDATDTFTDFHRDGVDIAIRYGTGHYPDLTVIPFLDENAVPVCSPALARHLTTPADLVGQTLLHAEWRMEREAAANWRLWLKAAHIKTIDPNRGLRFSSEAMLVQAAIDGLGVALTQSTLVEGDIAAGRLVLPFGNDLNMPTEFGHFIVYPKSSETVPKVIAFRDWALAEAVRPDSASG